MRIHTKFNGYEAGRRLYFKGGGGGGQVKYDNLEKLYEEQAASAGLLRQIAESNLPSATQAYVGNVQNVLGTDYIDRQVGTAAADMASANAQDRAATERSLQSMGVNPSDPRYASSLRTTGINNAARMAAGQNATRNQAQQYQLNVAKDAVGTFTGQSNNAATQMGNAASGLGSIYTSQANQKAMQDQQQSSAVGNAVAGGLMAYSMFKDGGRVRYGGLRTLSRDEYDRIAGGDRAVAAKNGGKVCAPKVGGMKKVERHMLGGSAGSQQGNSGFFQMQQVAPPPSFQAPQQQQQSPINMQTARLAKSAKDSGGMSGMGQRITDKIGRVAGKLSESAGNQIQSHAAGMGMDASQANAAADAYVQAAKSASDPALAKSYMEAAANIQSGAGGQLAAAPVAEATITPIGEAAGAAAADAAATTAATAAAEGAAGAAAAEGLAAAGAEAAATGLGTAAGAIGTALPWVGAAYAVGSLLDWWNEGGQVGTQNKGMSEAEAMRRFSDAFNAGEVNDLRAGGDVPGEWRENVDTVPALLVEGEGVLNAEAMALGGEKVMEDLNAKGLALREQGITPHDIKRGIGLRGLKKVKA